MSSGKCLIHGHIEAKAAFVDLPTGKTLFLCNMCLILRKHSKSFNKLVKKQLIEKEKLS